MEPIKISIIIPAYNAELYLPESLRSVINQDYDNWEIIAIDDGSTDKTLEILKQEQKRDPRIRYVSIENSGVSHARNIGLSLAKGDYILFLDADDLIISHSLKALSDICTTTNADIISFNYKKYYINTNIDNLKTEQSPHFFQISFNGFFEKVFNKFSKKNYLGGYIWLRLYKKSFIQNKKFNTELRWYEDEDFLCNLLSQSTKTPLIYHTAACFYLYRKRCTSTMNANRPKRLLTLYRVQRNMQKRFNKHSNNFKLLNSLRILTIIQLKQLSLSQENIFGFKLFRNCLLKNITKIPLKNTLPYLFGAKFASLYSSFRLRPSNLKKTEKFWP